MQILMIFRKVEFYTVTCRSRPLIMAYTELRGCILYSVIIIIVITLSDLVYYSFKWPPYFVYSFINSQVIYRTCLHSKYKLSEIRHTGPARRLATRKVRELFGATMSDLAYYSSR